MSSTRARTLALLAPALLTLALTLTMTAPQAGARTFTQQCNQSGTCMNLWNGGFDVESFAGTAANNNIAVQWLGNGTFELRDNVHGGCIADLGGAQGNAKAGGGQSCPSSGSAAWGSVFTAIYECPSGWAVYHNRHWNGNIFIPPGNGAQVYLNNRIGDCMRTEGLADLAP